MYLGGASLSLREYSPLRLTDAATCQSARSHALPMATGYEHSHAHALQPLRPRPSQSDPHPALHRTRGGGRVATHAAPRQRMLHTRAAASRAEPSPMRPEAKRRFIRPIGRVESRLCARALALMRWALARCLRRRLCAVVALGEYAMTPRSIMKRVSAMDPARNIVSYGPCMRVTTDLAICATGAACGAAHRPTAAGMAAVRQTHSMQAITTP
jgi:hypothetical protein